MLLGCEECDSTHQPGSALTAAALYLRMVATILIRLVLLIGKVVELVVLWYDEHLWGASIGLIYHAAPHRSPPKPDHDNIAARVDPIVRPQSEGIRNGGVREQLSGPFHSTSVRHEWLLCSGCVTDLLEPASSHTDVGV